MDRLITRRHALKITAGAILAAGTGNILLVATGCSNQASSTGSSADVTLNLAEGSFRIGQEGQSTTYSGIKLSVLPSENAGGLALCYTDENGEKTVCELAEPGQTVHITGDATLLTVDDMVFKAVVEIEKDANIKALCLGGIHHADIAGNVEHLIMVGSSDAYVLDQGQVGSVVMGDAFSDVNIESGAKVNSVHALFEAQVADKTASVPFVRIDEGYAAKVNKAVNLVSENNSAALANYLKSENDGLITDAAELVAGGTINTAQDETASTDAPTSEASTTEPPDDAPVGDEAPAEITEEDAAWTYQQADSESKGDIDASANIGGVLGALIADPLVKKTGQIIGNWVLKKGVSYGQSTLKRLMFGEDETVDSKLDEINSKLDQLQKQVEKVYEEVKASEYTSVINSFILDYQSKAATLIDSLDKYVMKMDSKNKSPEDLAKAQLEFARILLNEHATGHDDFVVNKENIVNFTKNYARVVVTDWAIGIPHLLDCYLKLCKIRSPWEHITNEARMAFQETICSQLGTLGAYCAFAIQGYLEQLDPEKDEALWNIQEVNWELLFGQKEALRYAEECGHLEEFQEYLRTTDDSGETENGYLNDVFEYLDQERFRSTPEDMRYFMLDGHELLLTRQAKLVKTSSAGGTKQTDFRQDADGHSVPSLDDYAAIMGAYEGKNLREILFDESEGGFAMPSGVTKNDLNFSTTGTITHTAITKAAAEYRDYYIPTCSDKCKTNKMHFAYYEKIYAKETWKWYEASALGLFLQGKGQ